ncbi:MAG: Fe-S cluster assembly protein SufD [Bacteroidia bacterium]
MATFQEQYKSVRKEFPLLQDKAMEHFNRLGFPTVRNEEWKYTNISPLVSKSFSFSESGFSFSNEDCIGQFSFLRNAILIVIENGRLNTDASEINSLPEGVEIKTILQSKHIPLVQKHFGNYADVSLDSFAALNTAFAQDGIVIHVQPSAIIDKPVYILNISSSVEDTVIMHNRLLIVAEKNSSSKFGWITISANPSSESFINAVNEIVTEENATVEFDIFQDENLNSFQICNSYVYQQRDSKFKINTLTTGGKIIRNKLHIKLDGENCETHLNGLYIVDGSQLVDNHTAVFHSKPHCNSNQMYKGIIGGKAHGVFNGKILVEKNAQKTNAFQSNKNILLSSEGVVNAKPQLEIFADDVKCTHGATTGQMDTDALFYLRSRGINEGNAKALLNLAFVNDVLENISMEEFKNEVALKIKKKLKATAK